MTTVGKVITLMIFAAIFAMAVTHAAGFSASTMTVGSEFNQSLGILSGAGRPAGTTGTVNLPTGGSFSLG